MFSCILTISPISLISPNNTTSPIFALGMSFPKTRDPFILVIIPCSGKFFTAILYLYCSKFLCFYKGYLFLAG